jgi:hypothetical protein
VAIIVYPPQPDSRNRVYSAISDAGCGGSIDETLHRYHEQGFSSLGIGKGNRDEEMDVGICRYSIVGRERGLCAGSRAGCTSCAHR